MLNGINNTPSIGKIAGTGGVGGGAPSGGASFADTLKGHIDEVAKLQREASQAVQELATNQTDDMAGVMSALQKSDVAFKTLLAIRTKLMDAYEEIRNMPI
jgi:flagellar hook-basal body complex protein FliE